MNFVKNIFYFDSIALVMLALLAFIGMCIGSFAFRYMKGDKRYFAFFAYLTLLILSIGIMVSADHLLVLFCGWCISNALLVRLMIHKSNWKAAKNSGFLAAKNYLVGAIFVVTGMLLLYSATGQTSIRELIQTHSNSRLIMPALFFLLLGGMTQSAIWPFHRWLLSSLNSPTPVSAIMHAGLINGGGFLLTRFAPLYLTNPRLLTIIYLIGVATALIGTLWKLMQHDVKRMLACSTMGQMGFMLAQCGLGLFPAAIAHLVTHGMFKAFLFLGSGGAALEKRHDLTHSLKITALCYAFVCGLFGSFCFAVVSGKSWLAGDTTVVLLVIALMTTTQAALTILALKTRYRIFMAITTASVIGLVYGASVASISKIMEPLQLMQPQPLNWCHIVGIVLLVLAWFSISFFKKQDAGWIAKPLVLKGYVAAMNASQPHPSTITTHRNQYKYL